MEESHSRDYIVPTASDPQPARRRCTREGSSQCGGRREVSADERGGRGIKVERTEVVKGW